MADRDLKIKIGADTKSAEDGLKRTADELKKTGAAAKDAGSGTDKFSSALGGLKTAAIAAAGAAALGAVVAGIKDVLNAAGQAETANVKLAASLKATGQYSAATVQQIDVWSSGLLRATGTSDELSKSLVANSLTMGLNVEQGKRLVEVATNMAPVIGSVESAMSLLVRAANGSIEGLKRYGIEVTEAEQKSGDFEAVLQRVERQFAGQAVAQLSTYQGQLNLLGEEFGELKETIGGKLLPAATAWLSWVNDAINKHRILTDEVESLNDAELRRKMLLLQISKAEAGTLGHYDTDLASVNAQIEALQELMNARGRARAEARASGTTTTTGSSTFTATGAKDTSKRKVVSFYGVNSKGETEFEEATNIAKALKELGRVRDASGYDLESTVAGQMDAQQEAAKKQRTLDSLEESYDFEMESEKMIDEQRESRRLQQIKDFSAYNFDAIQDEFAERKMLQDQELEAKRAMSLQIAADTATTIDGMLKAVASGDWVGAIKGALQSFGGPKGQIVSAVIDIFQTLVSLVSSEPKTEGGQARKKIGDVIADKFEELLGSNVLLNAALTDIEMDATGRADFWQNIGDAITGGSGGGTGNILAAQFEDLNLTTSETIDALGGLIASAQDLTQAEGDQIAAQTALLSIQELTTEELAAAAQAYGDATAFLERRAELEEAILEKAEEYASASGSNKDSTLKELESLRQDWLNLVVQEYRDQKESDETLKAALLEAGVSEASAQEIIDGQKSTKDVAVEQLDVLRAILEAVGGEVVPNNSDQTQGHEGLLPMYHHGKMVGGYPSHQAWIRDDEMVVPPEKYREARDYMTSAMGDSGGGSRTIVLTLDGKTVAKVVDGHTRAMRRTKEVAA